MRIDVIMGVTEKEIKKIRKEFEKRRKRRIGLFVFALGFLLIVGFVAIPLMDHFNVPKQVWAPFVYLVMFGVLIAIGVYYKLNCLYHQNVQHPYCN